MVDELTQKVADDMAWRFAHIEVTPEQATKMAFVRTRAYQLAKEIVEQVPDSRERSKALTDLEQVVFWANRGIAVHG